MLKKIFAFFAAMSLMAAFAAVDINKGSPAELETIKGIGPAKSKLIVEERKKGEFKSWQDFISRVNGFGEASAAKLSAEGLTVGGASFKPAAKDAKAAAPAKPDAKAEAKPMAKAEAKADAKPAAAAGAKADAKPAAAAPAKTEAKAEAKPEAPKK
ncbi:MAG: helix-hairpin-helix domain-containing protein [Betaproteobacteria bacterium]